MQDPSQVTIFQQRLVAMNRFIAPLFFVLSLGFLALTYHGLRSVGQWEGPLPETTALWGLIWLYPPFIVEACFYAWSGLPGGRQYRWSALLPPLRLTRRDLEMQHLIWWPLRNWKPADRQLARHVIVCEAGILWFGGIALIATAAISSASITSVESFTNHFVIDAIFGAMWVVVMADTCVLLIILPRARRKSLVITCLPILASPVVPLLVVAYLPRLVRRTMAWNELHHYGIRDPAERLRLLDAQLQRRTAEVEELQDQLRREQQLN
ncbi:hypothetical protein Spb1_38130 [Planctopirus ephydatiae]|uniref:Uncharacterized protein n=1 Tax=Planctopirus ephydatiae TaxID=2528019 RepID=A0A518GTF0_9PLAN|nr:hypothetical protein [Planctopirus ephydatiae]QDV31867.1 hypothetical protein Spb1_38130 [Planctopirus ephydatiae]